MTNHLTPSYLTKLLQLKTGQKSKYSLRSNEDFSQIPARTKRFKNSFLPSVITEWNQLDTTLRTSNTNEEFKTKLRDTFCTKYDRLYNATLKSQSSILHTRLRLGHCRLNY